MQTLFEEQRLTKEGLSPQSILRTILLFRPESKDYTIVVMGETGPTGKTWIYEKLKSNGFRVTEITEQVYKIVDYRDRKNHVLVDEVQRTIIIVLNVPIKRLRA